MHTTLRIPLPRALAALASGLPGLALALGLALAGLAPSPAHADDTPAARFGEALSPVFQADLPLALRRLRALPDEGLDASRRATRDCVLARFATPASTADASLPADLPPDVAAALAAFRRYWTAVLMHRASPAEAEAALSRDLGRLLPDAPADLDARSDAAVRLAESRGWHALGGVTEPLHEFMLWRNDLAHVEHAALPGESRPVDVTVHALNGFASFGWGAWGTCDRAHTGGWTTDAGAMVVSASWDLASEAYRVSLLAHEARHFADRARYPALAQTDLEFRAKLVELALARDTQAALLANFAAGGKRDRSLPHPFAEWWVVERLAQRLHVADRAAWSPDAVRAAARDELAAHTAALEAKGAAVVTSVLPD